MRKTGLIGRFNWRDTGRAALQAAAVVIQGASTPDTSPLLPGDPVAGGTGLSARAERGTEMARVKAPGKSPDQNGQPVLTCLPDAFPLFTFRAKETERIATMTRKSFEENDLQIFRQRQKAPPHPRRPHQNRGQKTPQTNPTTLSIQPEIGCKSRKGKGFRNTTQPQNRPTTHPHHPPSPSW